MTQTSKIRTFLVQCNLKNTKSLSYIVLLLSLSSLLSFIPYSQLKASNNNDAYISFLPLTSINTLPIYFKDIATCKNSSVCSELYGVRVGFNKKVGERFKISDTDLDKVLKKSYPDTEFKYLNQEISILSTGKSLSKDYILSSFKKFLSSILSNNFKVDILNLNIYKDIKISEGDFNLSFSDFKSILTESDILNICLTKKIFEVVLSTVSYQIKFNISASISINRSIPLAKHDILKNSKINSNDIYFKFIPVTYLNLRAYTSRSQILNSVSKTTIFKNQIFSSRNLMVPKLIEKDQILTLKNKDSNSNSSINISRTVKAKTSGDKGDIIKVLPLNSKKTIQAKIINSSTVETI